MNLQRTTYVPLHYVYFQCCHKSIISSLNAVIVYQDMIERWLMDPMPHKRFILQSMKTVKLTSFKGYDIRMEIHSETHIADTSLVVFLKKPCIMYQVKIK